MSKKGKIKIAREFRKNPTRSEEIMWSVLRNRQFLNLKFRRQYLVEGFLVDFFCEELSLAIEIDGSIHDEEEKIGHDTERQKIIEQNKIRFIRIESEDIEYNLERSLDNLKEKINKL